MERKYFKNLTDEERREIKQKIFQQLDLEYEGKVRGIASWKRVASVAVAASLIIAVGLFMLRPTNKGVEERILLASTNAGEIKHLVLADSSTVILNPSSSLYSTVSYSSSSGAREVFLEGNGFFKVRKLSSGRSFIVHANDQDVTVLGTAFNVNSRNGDFEVVLTSGKVKVTGNDVAAPEFMVPGDKLTRITGKNFERTQIDTSLYSPWIRGEWNFRNTSLGEIAELIAEYYNIHIEFTNPASKDLRMTAVFPVTNLDMLLDVIRETLPVSVSHRQEQIIIQ
jgi:ferric-dicitrate binding protein FerR (iron transport regulator)